MDRDDMPDLIYTFTANNQGYDTTSHDEPAANTERMVHHDDNAQFLPPPTARTTHTRLRDSSYIPRPPNAFILFRSSFIQNQKLADAAAGRIGLTSTTNHADLSRIIARHWRALPPHEKEEWEEKARRAQEEHRQRYPDWRFRPGGFRGGPNADGKSIARKKRPPGRAKVRKKGGDIQVEDSPARLSVPGTAAVGPGRGRVRRRAVDSIDTSKLANVNPMSPSISPSSSSGLNVPTSPSPSSSSPSATPETVAEEARRRSTRLTRSSKRNQAMTVKEFKGTSPDFDRLRKERGETRTESSRSPSKFTPLHKGKAKAPDPRPPDDPEVQVVPSLIHQDDKEDEDRGRRTIELSRQDYRTSQSSSTYTQDYGLNEGDYEDFEDLDNDDEDDRDSDSDYTASDESDEDFVEWPRGRSVNRPKRRRIVSASARPHVKDPISTEEETDNEGTVTGTTIGQIAHSVSHHVDTSFAMIPPLATHPPNFGAEPVSFLSNSSEDALLARDDVPLTAMFKKRRTEDRRSVSLPPAPYPADEQFGNTASESSMLTSSGTPFSSMSQEYLSYEFPGNANYVDPDIGTWESMKVQLPPTIPTSPATEPPTSPTSSPDTASSSGVSWNPPSLLTPGSSTPSFAPWYQSQPGVQNEIQFSPFAAPYIYQRQGQDVFLPHPRLSIQQVDGVGQFMREFSTTQSLMGSNVSQIPIRRQRHSRTSSATVPLISRTGYSQDAVTSSMPFAHYGRGTNNGHIRRGTVSFPISHPYHQRHGQPTSPESSSESRIGAESHWDEATHAMDGIQNLQMDVGEMGYVQAVEQPDFVIFHDCQIAHESSTSSSTLGSHNISSSHLWQGNPERVGLAASVMDPYMPPGAETHISTFSTLSGWAGDVDASDPSSVSKSTDIGKTPDDRGWHGAADSSLQPLGLAGGTQ